MNYGSFRTRTFTDHPKKKLRIKFIRDEDCHSSSTCYFHYVRRCVVYMKVVVGYQKLQNIAHAFSYLSKLSIMINAQ